MRDCDRGTVFIVLPAYNEEATLPPLLDSIRRSMDEAALCYRVLVVDDGSSDGTAGAAKKAAAEMPLELLVHAQNRGLAEAIRTGLAGAVSGASDADVIVTMDADNTQPPALIAQMVGMIWEGGDVVIASRYRKGAKVVGLTPYRRLLSYAASIVFRTLFPTRGVRDYTCGFRAYRASAMRRMFELYGEGPEGFVSEKGFSCMVDVLLKMRRHGLRFSEVPLVLRYDQKAGQSKMKVARTIMQTLALIGKRLGRQGPQGV